MSIKDEYLVNNANLRRKALDEAQSNLRAWRWAYAVATAAMIASLIWTILPKP